MVSAGMAPLEENLRATLMDIVRRCQSTVVQNYGRINSPQSGEIARTESPSFDLMQTLPPTFQSTNSQDSGPSLLPATQEPVLSLHETSNTLGRREPNAETVRGFYEEPPLWNTDLVDNPLDIGSSAPQNRHSDSGYGSFLFFCECPNRLNNYSGK